VDGSLPESRVALQVLIKIIQVKTVVVTLDQLDVQKQIQEEFPQVHILFTPTEKHLSKALDISCGLGFDLILDYGA